jgi:hypothetical protein
MKYFPFGFLQPWLRWLMAGTLLVAAVPLFAETCKEAEDLDPATRSALESTAKSFLGMSISGDVAGLRVLAKSSRLFSTTKTD